MTPSAFACTCCRAFHCFPRLSLVADGLTTSLPHLPSQADVAGSVKQSSRKYLLRAAHEGPRRRDRASRLRVYPAISWRDPGQDLKHRLLMLSTQRPVLLSGLRRLSYSEEKGTGFFRIFQERKARRQAPVRVCQQIPVCERCQASRRDERSSPNARRQIVVEWFSIMGHLCQRP